jgi:hypothetical protein
MDEETGPSLYCSSHGVVLTKRREKRGPEPNAVPLERGAASEEAKFLSLSLARLVLLPVVKIMAA